ncbi:MAG: histidine kinase [Bacteroidales bacterium]
MKISLFEGKRMRVILHVLAWTILLSIPVYFAKRWQIPGDFLWVYYINALITGSIFYINYFLLVPRYYFSNRKSRYFVSVALLLIFFYFVSDGSNKVVFNYMKDEPDKMSQPGPGQKDNLPGPPRLFHMPGRPPFRDMHLFNYLFSSGFLVFFSLGLRVIERHSKIEQVQKELEKEKLNSELAFLKNQISPHFFFNTLNNIYSLIGINPDDSREAVLKLSKMMRYMLYESEKGDTRLSSEIEFMSNYIDLMKLRLSERVSLRVIFPDKYEDIAIPPLIFIPFIENAFKHGISFRENSAIEIRLSSSGKTIEFSCINNVPRVLEPKRQDAPGIGLDNVKKRLGLLFPGKHELRINRSESVYEVQLRISTAQ